VLSKLTLANAAGEDVVIHEDSNTSKRILISAKGLVGVGPLRETKRVRPQAHGSINETAYQEGRLIQLVGEVASQVGVEDALAEFRKISGVLLESVDNGGALLKWSEGLGTQNLAPNPSLEYVGVGTTGWAAVINFNAAGATLTRVTTQHESGVAALQVKTDGTLGFEGAELAIPGTFRKGVAYTFSAYLKGAVGGESMEFAIGVGADDSVGSGILTTAWQRFSVTWTPTADRTGVSIDTLLPAKAEATWFVDAVMVNEGATAPAYIDGDSSGATWEGEPGNSPSGFGRHLQQLVKLDSECEPVLQEAAALLQYPVSLFAADPRAYSQALTELTGGTITGTEPEEEYVKATASVGGAIAIDGTYIYYVSKAGCIGRCKLNGTGVEPEWIKGLAATPRGIAVNGEHIYWVSASRFIGRAAIAGTGVEPEWTRLTLTGSGLRGIAIDAEHVYVGYGASGEYVSIARCTLAGGSVNEGWMPLSGSGVQSLAVDAGHVYWTTGSSAIGRATLAGASIEPEWITGGSSVQGVTVSATYVYWTNYTGNTLGRAKLAGTEVTQAYQSGTTGPQHLAVNSEYVYWFNLTTGYVGRAAFTAGAVGGSLTVAQAGNRPTPLTFKIHGPIKNPSVTRTSDGSRIALKGTIASGNYVEVNTADRTVKLNGTSNLLSFLNAQNTNWEAFSPLASTVYTLTGSSATAAYMEASYRSAYA